MEDEANRTISEIAAMDLAFRNESDPARERLVWLSQDRAPGSLLTPRPFFGSFCFS